MPSPSDILSKAYLESDKYQAAYKSPTLSAQNSRPSLDRCEAIEKHLEPLNRKSILDVGCAQGYSSLYFADRGANVLGIDAVENNVKFCRLLAANLEIQAAFDQQFFSDETINFAIANGIDVIFFLSVLHHITTARGLPWAQAAMTRLLGNGITIIAELAIKGEKVKFGNWQDYAPDDALSIFGDHRANKIADCALLEGKVIRPLYLIACR